MYLFFLERYPHSIFAAGGAYVPTQEKKNDSTIGSNGSRFVKIESTYGSRFVKIESTYDI